MVTRAVAAAATSDQKPDVALNYKPKPFAEHLSNPKARMQDIPEILFDPEADDPIERSLVRKLDMTLMPIVFILYLFNYLDRNNIA